MYIFNGFAILTHMKEGIPNFPFREGELIGESKYGNVYGYPNLHMVVKQWKEKKRVPFESAEAAIARIGILKSDLAIARSEAISRGASPDIFTNTDYVVHADQAGSIVYSSVQDRVVGARTLSDEKLGVLGLPSQSLKDIRTAFIMSLENFIKNGKGYDIVGSSSKKRSLPSKVFRVLAPLISSENIVIDESQSIHYIDFEIYRQREGKPTIKRKAYMAFEAFGTAVSIPVIDAVLLFRKITGRENT